MITSVFSQRIINGIIVGFYCEIYLRNDYKKGVGKYTPENSQSSRKSLPDFR